MIVVGRDPERLAAAKRVLDNPPESVMMSHQEAAAGMAAIKNAIATSDEAALEAYGGLNPGLQRAHPQPCLCRKPPIHGRDHDGPDVALDASAA